jgi:hypothetical protein
MVVSCASTCSATQVPIACSGPSDCLASQVCCGTRSGTTAYTQLACADTCDGQDQNIACATDQDCTAGTTCLASTILPDGFTVCR